MQMKNLRLRVFVFVAGVAMLAFSGWASADPPSRVARLGYLSGAVSFSAAGENDWDQATINRTLTSGDRLWTSQGARAEIQVGGAAIRMNEATSVAVLNLDNRIAQLQLTQGTLNIRVRRLGPTQVFEVATPNLAFTLRQPGEYRIAVDPDGNATDIIVRKGRGEAYGEGAAHVVDSRQAYRFMGTGLREYEYVDAPRFDEFDHWASARDRSYDNSASARYVSQDVVGYQDLDANGIWRVDAAYGNVWIPNRVAAGWAPYRDGHWAWVNPWGWTWVDDAPWGFAVSHYGRWANFRGTWAWVPGPAHIPAYYAPALVVFVGGNNFQLAISSGNVGGIGWFPLGPREVYQPAYPVSRRYFENINSSNTVINNIVINNYYNNLNVTNVVYANRHVRGALVAVPTSAFVQSQPVSRAAVRVSPEMLAGAPVAAIAPVAPIMRGVRGAAGPGDKPPARAFERPVVARNVPPAAHEGFAVQREPLTAKPGRPLDDAAHKEFKPPAAAVVAPEPRARFGQRDQGGQREQAVAPRPPPPPLSAIPAPPAKPEPVPAAKQGESRPPVASTKPPPLPPHTQAAPRAEPDAKKYRPATSKPIDLENERDEHQRAEENRRQKR